MKRFVWRLQRVLDIRRKEEQIKRAELLEITEKLAHTRGELLIRKRMLKDMIDSLTEEHPRSRLGKQEFFLKCSAATDELINKLESKVNELKTQQKAKIAEVLKVKRFTEGLKKLRVEAKTQFIKEQERLEQKDADEMTIMGFARKKGRENKVNISIG
jgi:flagellar FliJ protein